MAKLVKQSKMGHTVASTVVIRTNSQKRPLVHQFVRLSSTRIQNRPRSLDCCIIDSRSKRFANK